MDLDTLQRNTPERRTANPQQLWKVFKTDIQNTAKKMMKDLHYKLNTCIRLLEKDKKALANDPRADTCNNICTSEAMVTNQLSHLIEKKVCARKMILERNILYTARVLQGSVTQVSVGQSRGQHFLSLPDPYPPKWVAGFQTNM